MAAYFKSKGVALQGLYRNRKTVPHYPAFWLYSFNPNTDQTWHRRAEWLFSRKGSARSSAATVRGGHGTACRCCPGCRTGACLPRGCSQGRDSRVSGKGRRVPLALPVPSATGEVLNALAEPVTFPVPALAEPVAHL